MTHHRRVLEAIDACRPGSDDLQQPDLAFLAIELSQDPHARELYQRTQQFDATLAAAMGDVPVPDGLAARILARVTAADSAGAAVDLQPAKVSPAPVSAAPVARRISRRWLGAAAAGMAVAAAVAVLVANLSSGPEVNKDNVADFALQFFQAAPEQNPGPGRLISLQPAPQSYPLSGAILASGHVRWRPITGLLGGKGVAYDLAAPDGGAKSRATLYVVLLPATLTGLAGAPPSRPLATTAGVAIGAWQVNGLLYILAVSGDEKRYQSFLRTESLA